MSVYTHLTLSEREYLEGKLTEGVSIRKIAAALERSPSTISRELRRNGAKRPIVITTGTPIIATSTAENAVTARITSQSTLQLFLLFQKPGCHVPQGLLDRARLICKAFRCSSMAETTV